MIGIVNYGLGNVEAIANIFRRLNEPVLLASSAEELRLVDRIILPGVGAFDNAMHKLDASGMRSELETAVMSRGKPVLGICVGMQMLAERSEEGSLPGLGWIPADVLRFEPTVEGKARPLPHMGWNDVRPSGESGLFRELETDARFYFLHSYHFRPRSEANVIGVTEYGAPFVSAVAGGANIFGVQFHPEKSHHWGIQLLKNFSVS